MRRALLPFALLVLLACNTASLTPALDSGSDPGDADLSDGGVFPFPTTGEVSLVVEPGDNAAGLLAAITGAKTSVHMTMYLLSNPTFINALIARKKAGVDVRVVLNQTFPDPMFDNNQSHSQLVAGGVPVVWSSKTFNFTHAKVVVVDGSSAWIMTMNITGSSAAQNREYLAVDTNPDDVAEAEAVFAGDYAATTPALTGRLVLAPDNARARISALFGLAKTTLDVEAETFSDLAFQADLQNAKARGVAVRIVVSDQTPSNAMVQAIAALKASGIVVKKLATPYVHAKGIVADGTVGYVGSANLTQNSVDQNREVGLMITGAALETLGQTIDGDYRAAAVY